MNKQEHLYIFEFSAGNYGLASCEDRKIAVQARTFITSRQPPLAKGRHRAPINAFTRATGLNLNARRLAQSNRNLAPARLPPDPAERQERRMRWRRKIDPARYAQRCRRSTATRSIFLRAIASASISAAGPACFF